MTQQIIIKQKDIANFFHRCAPWWDEGMIRSAKFDAVLKELTQEAF